MDTRTSLTTINNQSDQSKITPKRAAKRFHRYFDYVRPEVMQRLKNRGAKLYNVLEQLTKGHRPYDEIGAHSDIFLGVIPTLDMMQVLAENAKKREKNISIVSIVDVFEFTSGVGTIRPKDCQKNSWNHYHLPMTDYTPDMEIENIIAAAKAIRDAKQRGDVVYIHCKAGKARSAMVLAVYFALYDDAFRQTLGGYVLQNPHLLLKASIEHIKKIRPQVDLHNELIDKLAKDSHVSPNTQWERFFTEQDQLQKEIEAKYSKTDIFGNINKANIGKLCNAYNAIASESTLQHHNAITNAVTASTDYAYDSEHFLNALVQSAPFKELVIFAWEIEKNTLIEPKRKEYLDAFLSLLDADPASAINDLCEGFLQHNLHTNIGQLLFNAKSREIIDIIERLFVSVKNYDVYHVMQPTLIEKASLLGGSTVAQALNASLQSKNIAMYLNKNYNTQKMLTDIINFCSLKNDLELKSCVPLFDAIKKNDGNLLWLLNLEKACTAHLFYERNKNTLHVRTETLERLGVPFGLLFAKLNADIPEEAAILNGLVKLCQHYLSELGTECNIKELAKVIELTPREMKSWAGANSNVVSIANSNNSLFAVTANTTTIHAQSIATDTRVKECTLPSPQN